VTVLYSRTVADLPLNLAPELAARLAKALDVEGKIPRTFQALGPMGGADVVLVHDDGALRPRQLRDLGARVTVVDASSRSPLDGLGDAAADFVVSCWSWFRDDLPAALLSAERVLRPGGRLLILHDYGRDDVSRLRSPDLPEYTTWSRRDGWFLRTGFKVRVLHCWWTFESINEATSFLEAAFAEAGRAVGVDLKRPRLSYNVAIYHRTRGTLSPE
jgi:SAM-dependent methyltransferase